tara:strand:+ start:1320 stop:3065 length:1746 start_codon:yes stop_codon:yes gene_type:complete
MAIIYTYPDLGAVDGTEKLLVSDGSDENNTKTVTTAAYGAYINATYGGAGGLTIYQANGSIDGNRTLSGGGNSLTFSGLSLFTVASPTTFSDTVQLDSTVIIPTGAVSGRVLTTDDAGLTTWQAIPDSTILTVNGTTNRISVTDSGGPNPVIDIDSGYVGQASIITLGTITTGTWQGTAITELYGGTGQTGYTAGDLLYSDSLNSLGKLSVGAADKVLVGGTLPSWGNINNSHWSGTALSAANGGTGQAGGYTVGDILYASGTTTLSKLPAGSTVGHVLTSNGASTVPSWQSPSTFSGTKSLASTQWNTPDGGGNLASLSAGDTINIFSLIDNAVDKSSAGSTSYYEFNILDDRKARFDTGTGDPMQIVYNGVDTYTGAWSTNLNLTVQAFVTAQNAGGAGTLLGDHGIRCGVDEDSSGVVLNSQLRMSVDNGGSGDLSLLAVTTVGSFITPSAGLTAAAPARIQVQYVGTPIDNQFITHNFRINFETDNAGGSDPEPHSLKFKRWGNGTTIGAPYTFFQTANASDPNSNLVALISYTSSPTDAFVSQGFFFEIEAALDAIDLENKIGLLIQTYFQEPTSF